VFAIQAGGLEVITFTLFWNT